MFSSKFSNFRTFSNFQKKLNSVYSAHEVGLKDLSLVFIKSMWKLDVILKMLINFEFLRSALMQILYHSRKPCFKRRNGLEWRACLSIVMQKAVWVFEIRWLVNHISNMLIETVEKLWKVIFLDIELHFLVSWFKSRYLILEEIDYRM